MKEMDKKGLIIKGVLLVIVVAVVIAYMQFFRTFTVTFDSKMGTSIKSQEVRINNSAEVPNAPMMTGYTFAGWYLGEEEFNFETKITKDITLTAKWEKIGE